MLGAVWVGMRVGAGAALLLDLPFRKHNHLRGVRPRSQLDPMSAVGEWFTVYSFGDIRGNVTEKRTIRVLNSSQLEHLGHLAEYYQMLKGYSKDKLKLEMKIHRVRVVVVKTKKLGIVDKYKVVYDTNSVLMPQDDAGNAVDFVTFGIEKIPGCAVLSIPSLNIIKWMSVDGFLVIMQCSTDSTSRYVDVLSKTTTPDEDKLQRAVDSLHIEGITGHRLYA